MQHLEPVLIVGIIFGAVAFVIKTISDNRMRTRLIENKQLDENIKFLFPAKSASISSVKWGLVLIGLGAALFLGRLFPYDVRDEMTAGFMFLFAGLSFIIYYMWYKKTEQENQV